MSNVLKHVTGFHGYIHYKTVEYVGQFSSFLKEAYPTSGRSYYQGIKTLFNDWKMLD